MTARQSANSTAEPANTAKPRKRAPAKRSAPTKAAVPTAGQRLVAELAKDNDPYALRFLIEQAGHIADYLERLHALHAGDRDAWLKVKIGAKTVEVVVNDPLREVRAQAEQLRRMLAEIHRQRAAIPMGNDDSGDPLDRY
ncbi:hypothetical protein [[Mycobacterium] crassicus]|uniref:Terminase small subunit n=1 Tax=[Mycobacterium] crassicus TaxID=2872309 RepID=A0ABU5XGJ1_9MYCO|nr:hypothetical protein [Mycolicibacter sp. MYC098]MEB3021301.1 hypothetical protein [Mycolicibacter sp. MYC098]